MASPVNPPQPPQPSQPPRPEQLATTDRLFFEFCLAHSPRAYEAMAPAPAELNRRHAAAMVRAARVLYRALHRHTGAWDVPPFPLRDAILGGSSAGEPARPADAWWSRFDAFVRAAPDSQTGSGIFFAELNLDRPGGHREALADPVRGPRFRRRFLTALQRHWQRCGPAHRRGQPPRAAFLVDPAHREELHIAHLYSGLLGELGWPCTVVGPRNLSVAGDTACAFGEPIDLLLRQFPAEFLHEVPAAPDLLRLHQAGRLLIVNDPAAVAGQAKSCFAWLWEQALAGDATPATGLTRAEIAAVRASVPYTALMTRETLPADPGAPAGPRVPTPLALLQARECWVLKPVLGRYSQGVAVGALATPAQWGEAVAGALAEPAYWIAQQYIAPAPQPLARWSDGQVENAPGYVNWGLHFLGGRPAGLMARCSRSPVTDDSWFAPVVTPKEARPCS